MSAIRLLQEHRAGATHDEISDAIREVVAAVTDEQKAGRVAINITVKPRGKGDGLDVAVECKAFPPKATPGVSTFFADKDNNLSRQDPRQANMDLRPVPAAAHKGIG
jgi:hypothetical protein